MKVRRLNHDGVQAFSAYLRQRRDGKSPEPPMNLLQDPECTEPIPVEAEIETRSFPNRMSLAAYLNKEVFTESWGGIEKDIGLWTWIALFYIGQICPPERQPKKLYSYVLRGDDNHRHYYRHLANGPFRLYRSHGSLARVMLAGPLDQHPDMAEQLASRQNIVTNTALIRAADYLYWDPEREDHSVGAASRNRSGAVRRLIDVTDQVARTYDLFAMTAQDIVDLLPDEFREWQPEADVDSFNGEAYSDPKD